MNDEQMVAAWIRYQKKDDPAEDDPDWPSEAQMAWNGGVLSI
jgi:hypothetical protein